MEAILGLVPIKVRVQVATDIKSSEWHVILMTFSHKGPGDCATAMRVDASAIMKYIVLPRRALQARSDEPDTGLVG